jgi:uncharacterized membrane protein YgcG
MTRITTFSIVVLVTVSANTTVPAGAESTPPLKGDVVGSFFFHACPPEARPMSACLHDDITGTLAHLGRTTGSFEVVFDLAAFGGANNCGPIRKQGSFIAANGDRLDVEAEGTFCFGTLVATYDFQVTGGTGRFAGSGASGSWLVPPPTSFDGVAGVGEEFLEGVLVK